MTDLEQQWTRTLESASGALEAAARAQTLPAVVVGAYRGQLERERIWLTTVDWASFGHSHSASEALRPSLAPRPPKRVGKPRLRSANSTASRVRGTTKLYARR